jgi:hypothetical protein
MGDLEFGTGKTLGENETFFFGNKNLSTLYLASCLFIADFAAGVLLVDFTFVFLYFKRHAGWIRYKADLLTYTE